MAVSVCGFEAWPTGSTSWMCCAALIWYSLNFLGGMHSAGQGAVKHITWGRHKLGDWQNGAAGHLGADLLLLESRGGGIGSEHHTAQAVGRMMDGGRKEGKKEGRPQTPTSNPVMQSYTPPTT